MYLPFINFSIPARCSVTLRYMHHYSYFKVGYDHVLHTQKDKTDIVNKICLLRTWLITFLAHYRANSYNWKNYLTHHLPLKFTAKLSCYNLESFQKQIRFQSIQWENDKINLHWVWDPLFQRWDQRHHRLPHNRTLPLHSRKGAETLVQPVPLRKN